MKRILFVCHGNICRSVMAEYIMKDIVKDGDYYIESAATSYEEIGNDIYYLAKETLNKHHIPYSIHHARHIRKEDINDFDLIIGMDQENMDDLYYYFGHSSKIHHIMEYLNLSRDVIDPWYSRRFEDCFNDLYKACNALFNHLEK